MTAGLVHQISALDAKPGELSFDATVEGETRRIWFRSETKVDPYPEAALATALMPAQRSGGTLRMEAPISPRVLRTQREFQAIQAAWSLDWPFGDPPLREVEVVAPVRHAEPRQPTGRVAAFFSGGVDSWWTVLAEPEITDLIFVHGLDILPRLAHQEGLGERVEAELRAAAGELGLPLHVVETNLRDLAEVKGPEDPLVHWETYYNSALAAVALFLGRAFDRVLIGCDYDYEVQVNYGASWTIDHLWSNETLEIVDAGGRFSRVERTAIAAASPIARKTLRVCWENPDGAYNCGRCRKCLMTMATLEAFGMLDQVETLPDEFDLEWLAAQEPPIRGSLIFWEETLEAVQQAGKPELESALAKLVSASRRRLGMPFGYRSRRPQPHRSPGAAPVGSLFATPETARAIAAAPAIAALVGGYDGSGNYGDIALLDAALGMLNRLKPHLLVLPVVERQFAATHKEMAGELVNRAGPVLYFNDSDGSFEDSLVAVDPPEDVGLGVSYLYGGGYLNPSWGERKLAMLRAVETLLAGAAQVTRVSSGMQVDGDWIAALGPADVELLRGFELLAARDRASANALATLTANVLDTGDDAVGVLPEPPEETSVEANDPLEVGVHFGGHEWVTGRPDTMLDFDTELLAELARLAGGRLRVRPLLAYVDPRIDERPAVDRLATACRERGLEVAEPRLLRPMGLGETGGEMAGAILTVSSSFHVALTSLLLGVPAVLLRDNGYYDQKARGLLDDFEQPDSFSPRPDEDPRAIAATIAPLVLDPEGGHNTRRRLRETGERVRRRRRRAEAELLGIIAKASLGTMPPPSAGGDHGAANAQAEEAERRAAAAEAQLREVLGSHSWKVTAPLRRARARRSG